MAFPPATPTISELITSGGPRDQEVIRKGAATNDPTPVVTGYGRVGTNITIYVDGKTAGTGIVDSDGTWRIEIDSATPIKGDGYKIITAVASNAAGASAPSQPYPIEFDTMPPNIAQLFQAMDSTGDVQGEIMEGCKTDEQRPVLKGTGEAGDTVVIYIDGKENYRVLVNNDDTWSFGLLEPLPEGEHEIHIQMIDPAGNISEAGQSLRFVVEVHEVFVEIHDALDDYGPIQGVISHQEKTDDATPTLRGKALPDSTLTLYDENGSVLTSFKVAGDGVWSYELPPQAEGLHSYKAVVQNLSGTTAEAEFSLTVDRTPPDARPLITGISEDTGGSSSDFITNDQTLIIHGGVSSPLGDDEKVQISVDGGPWLDAVYNSHTQTWHYDNRAVLLSEGEHEIVVRTVDEVGNIGPHAQQTVIIDVTPPSATSVITAITDDTGVAGDFVTSDQTLIIHGRVDGRLGLDERVQVSIDNGKVWRDAAYNADTNSWELDNRHQALAHGTYTFKTRVIDSAGNFDASSVNSQDVRIIRDKPTNEVTIDYYVDDYGPVKGIFYSGSSTDDKMPTLHGKIDAPLQEGQKIAIYRGVTLLGYAAVDENNPSAWSFRDKGLISGKSYLYNTVIMNDTGTRGRLSDPFEIHIVPEGTTGVPDIGKGEDSYSASVALGNNGEWIIVSDQSVYMAAGNDFSTYSSQLLTWNGNDASHIDKQYRDAAPVFGAYTLADYNRDGFVDIFTTDRTYHGSTGTMFFGADNGYMSNAFLVHTGTTIHFGGVMSLDMDGDGYLDVILGDSGNDSMTFLRNRGADGNGDWYKGQWDVYGKDSGLTASSISSLIVDHEVSGVDLNNDGTVDFVGHAYQGSSYKNALTILLNDGTSSKDGFNWRIEQVINDVFATNGKKDDTYDNTVSLTWGDYNGDGYLDLFIGQGHSDAALAITDSFIFYNKGDGPLETEPQRIADRVEGKTSVAVDWDCDGNMDVIELPAAKYSMKQSALFYHHTGRTDAKGHVVWALSKLADVRYMQMADGSLSFDRLSCGATGAAVVDYDWDGALDLVVSTKGLGKNSCDSMGSVVVNNCYKPDYGTALHLRILSPDGANTFYGNSVQLYDSKGRRVSTQIINAQSGSGQNDGTGLVHFYGLNKNETYSAVLLHNKKGIANDFGGIESIFHNRTGFSANIIENYNSSWSNLKARASYDSYVLTAEAEGSVSHSLPTAGIVGTGYNDTFFASEGIHLYNGGGGWIIRDGVKTWSASGGEDIVDFKLAGFSAIHVDLSISGYQNTGFGNIRFVNIEGVYGAGGHDTFTDGQGDNIFNGRGGDDTYNLLHGGHNTILFELINAEDETGGNGCDTVNGFTVADFNNSPASDRIDLSQLLIGYERDIDGAAHYVDGVARIDEGDTIADYLSVRYEGNDTTLYIDRNGRQEIIDAQALIVLSGVHVSLETLLANHQIVV